ncbi:hypothetical protein MRX96_059231 [Rhipicephalus microplus]
MVEATYSSSLMLAWCSHMVTVMDSKPAASLDELRSSPRLLDVLHSVDVTRIFCGAHFNMALSRSNMLYIWDSSKQLDSPAHLKVVGGLEGHMITDVAVGIPYCAAVTAEGRVFMWNSSEWTSSSCAPVPNMKPFPVCLHAGNVVAGIALQ